MKQLLLSLLFSAIFIAGESQQTKQLNNPFANAWSSFKSAVPGQWIKSSYLENLTAKRSALAAAHEAESRMIAYIIDPSMIRAALIEVQGQTLHEGGYDFKIFRKQGIKPGTFMCSIKEDEFSKAVFADATFTINGKDTSMVFYHYNKSKKLLGTTSYIKSGQPQGDAFDHKVNEVLFAGTWHYNNAGKSTQVSFSADGSVTGFEAFDHYLIFTDFTVALSPFDEMRFTAASGAKKDYAWEIKENQLLLYEVTETKPNFYKKGELKYTLIKD